MTSRRLAIAAVYEWITSTTHDGSVGGGITQAESPEWTPASSTCSITPPISTSPVASRIASTSTSVASARNRSISTGRSAERPPSLPRLPKPASSSIALRQVVAVVDDLHRPATEHVARPDEHREADVVGDRQRLLEVAGGATGRLRDEQFVADLVPPLPVLGGVDRVGRRAGHQLGRDLAGQLQRGLPAERHDDAVRTLRGQHVEHVFLGQRLEVQAVGRVVVGRHRLRVAVDHHRLEAGLAQGERRVHAAVVELDALADAVGTGSEDDDLLAVARADLGLVLVRGVVVRRLGGELGGTGVDGLVGRDARRRPRGRSARRTRRRPTGTRAGHRRTRAAWHDATTCASSSTAALRRGRDVPRRSSRSGRGTMDRSSSPRGRRRC